MPSTPIKRAFPPVANAHTRLLILGSLPGEMSLSVRRYYAHPQNAFWRLTGAMLEEDIAALPYEARLERLLACGVGLWDTIETATRQGSLDAAIKDAQARDLPALAATLPSLRAMAFNGAKSAAIGMKAMAGSDLALVRLPSSSPAHAVMSFEAKAEAWRELRRFLD